MAFPVDLAARIVLLLSTKVDYTIEHGAKCPLCGQPRAHSEQMKDPYTRYHKCQTCGCTFSSICKDIISNRKKRNKVPENVEVKPVDALTFVYNITNMALEDMLNKPEKK